MSRILRWEIILDDLSESGATIRVLIRGRSSEGEGDVRMKQRGVMRLQAKECQLPLETKNVKEMDFPRKPSEGAQFCRP